MHGDDRGVPTLTTQVRTLDEFALVQGPPLEVLYVPMVRR
jgi:hypothetical protein